jgi:hypothetical protein
MIEIPFDDSRLSYLGRWFETGGGISSAWQGAQLRFRVSGTTQIQFTADVQDNSSGARVTFITNLDGGDCEYTDFTSAGEITGLVSRTATYSLPDSGSHTIIVKPSVCLPLSQWALSAKMILKTISIDDGGTLSSWPQRGYVSAMCIGDSWMAAFHDWPRLMPDQISIYPVSFGGAKISELESMYAYTRSGVLAPADPTFSAVIINSSVNDYNGGVSEVSFETSLSSLVDKVRADQPDAIIFIVQSPDNTGAGRIYSKYGPNMATVASTRDGVEYIPIAGIPTLTWLGDNAHLDFASRQILATFVATTVLNSFPHVGSVILTTDSAQAVITYYPDPGSGNRNAPGVIIDGTYYPLDLTIEGFQFINNGVRL